MSSAELPTADKALCVQSVGSNARPPVSIALPGTSGAADTVVQPLKTRRCSLVPLSPAAVGLTAAPFFLVRMHEEQKAGIDKVLEHRVVAVERRGGTQAGCPVRTQKFA